jgi:hypothetical protein
MSRTYRTVCVRLCDGFYWPMSYNTTKDHFDQDAQGCESSCAAPARLFVMSNPGEDVDSMVDVKGQPYRRLPTAFRYRTTYDASCSCRAQPWEQASLDRHRLYALEAQQKKGNKLLTPQIAELKTGLQKAAVATRTAAREAASKAGLLARGDASAASSSPLVPGPGSRPGSRPGSKGVRPTAQSPERVKLVVEPNAVRITAAAHAGTVMGLGGAAPAAQRQARPLRGEKQPPQAPDWRRRFLND